MPAPKIPKLKDHPCGQSYAYHKGKYYYFGKIGTPEAQARYDEWVARFVLNGYAVEPPRPAPEVTVAKAVKRLAGQLSRTTRARLKAPLAALLDLYGRLDAAELDALAFDVLRAELVRRGLPPGEADAAAAEVRELWAARPR